VSLEFKYNTIIYFSFTYFTNGRRLVIYSIHKCVSVHECMHMHTHTL